MASITELQAKLKEKLETLTGDGNPLVEVFDYINADSNGFPYVTFESTGMESQIDDTCDNMRTYKFDIYLYNNILNTDRSSALSVLYSASNSIINLLDENWQLDGLSEGGVKPVSIDYGQLIGENGTTLLAIIKVEAKTFYNINL